MTTLLARKIGMTRYFLEDGKNLPVTVLQAGPCVITQVKTDDGDGYDAVQIAFEEVKPRRSTMPVIGHDAKAGTVPHRHHREFRVDADHEYEIGQSIDVSSFEGTMFVDVVGTSKGKGFAGVVKRYHFAGLEASHGVKRAHRKPGSIGGHSANLGTGPKIKKGKRMAGRMGGEHVTCRNLDVVSIDSDRNLILVKGGVPGPVNGVVLIRTSARLGRAKGRKVANAAG
jgi:large subunit ribosomal protein L3